MKNYAIVLGMALSSTVECSKADGYEDKSAFEKASEAAVVIIDLMCKRAWKV